MDICLSQLPTIIEEGTAFRVSLYCRGNPQETPYLHYRHLDFMCCTQNSGVRDLVFHIPRKKDAAYRVFKIGSARDSGWVLIWLTFLGGREVRDRISL